MNDVLHLTAHLPLVQRAAGEPIVEEGRPGGALWVLASGRLVVSREGVELNHVTRPGALIGEVSTLLGTTFGATVRAAVPSELRYAADGPALLREQPALMRLLAIGLAERLDFVTRYLVDLQHQYAGAPGLAMVGDVLRELAQRQSAPARPGSVRDRGTET